MRVKRPFIILSIAVSVLLVLSLHAIAAQLDFNTLSFTAPTFTGNSPYNVSGISSEVTLPGFTPNPIVIQNNSSYTYAGDGDSGIVSLPASFISTPASIVSPAHPQTPLNGSSSSPQLVLPPNNPLLGPGETSVAVSGGVLGSASVTGMGSGSSGSTNDSDVGSVGRLVYTPPHPTPLNAMPLISS